MGAFEVIESSLALYAEAVWQPTDRLMIIGALRNDWYRFETDALRGPLSWSGTVKDDTFAPKIGANYQIAEGITLYANYGEGSTRTTRAASPIPTTPRQASSKAISRRWACASGAAAPSSP